MSEWTTAMGWDKWHEVNVRNMRPVADWMLAAAGVAPGQRVLDVACGTGHPAIPAAARVRPGGTVIATDVSNDMLAIAARKAREAGTDNLELREMDAQELQLADASVDAVTCAFGLMFCPDPVRAATEIRRVLKPGGRFAIVVWDLPAKIRFFTTNFQAVAQVTPPPAAPPDPKAPGMFRLGPPGELEAVLRAAGLADVAVEPIPIVMESASIAAHFEMFADMAPPVHAAIATLPPAEVARLRATFADALAPYLVDGRVQIPATALGATGRKA